MASLYPEGHLQTASPRDRGARRDADARTPERGPWGMVPGRLFGIFIKNLHIFKNMKLF